MKSILKSILLQGKANLATLKRKHTKSENEKFRFDRLINRAHKLGYIIRSEGLVKVTKKGKDFTLIPDIDGDKPGFKKAKIKPSLHIDAKNARNDARIVAEAYKIPIIFNYKSRKEAESYPKNIDDIALEHDRLDLRDLDTVTIDGVTSKDFDDAISIEKQGENYKIGVHIADVSHFVSPVSALDKEARKRGNSVYLMDTVYPMFPEALSNGLCSLNENVTRFTMTAFITIDKNGNVVDRSFHKSAIKSRRRLTYDYVQDIIDGVEQDEDWLKNMLDLANECKVILSNKRFKEGSIDFNFKEIQVDLAKDGNPKSFYYAERKESHKIIEELMLLANCEVARRLSAVDGAIYRVHGAPDNEKLDIFATIAFNRGYKVEKNKEGLIDFNKIIAQVRDKPDEKLVLTLLLRSMQQAIYDTHNLGHFGLGFDCYTHFTSPIRRYTDLLVHRMLKNEISKSKDVNNQEHKKTKKEPIKKIYTNAALWCSKTERVAVEAERDLRKIKSVRFMKNKTGEQHEGIISGVAHFGFFVEISKYGIEGLIRYADMRGNYIYDDKEQSAYCHEAKKRYTLADKITITVLRVDVENLFVDFLPV